MAYTRNWNSAYELIPDGGDQRNTVDDVIRNFKVDVRERLDSLVVDFTADEPIVLKPETAGAQIDKELLVAGAGFQSLNATALKTDTQYGGGVVSYGNNYYRYALTIPATAVLKTLSIYVSGAQGGGSGLVDAGVSRFPFGTFTQATVGTIPQQTGNFSIPTLKTVSLSNHIVLPDQQYIIYANVTGNPSVAFFGAKIIYDIPTALALR